MISEDRKKIEYSMSRPVDVSLGEVYFASQFRDEKTFKAVYKNLDRDKTKLYDEGKYLFYVHSSDSLYARMGEADRYKFIVNDGRIENPEWLERFIDTKAMKALTDRYNLVSSTPAERLHAGLVESITKWLQDASSIKVADGDNPMTKVRLARDLFDSLKETEDMKVQERKMKIKKGYIPKKFEAHPDQK